MQRKAQLSLSFEDTSLLHIKYAQEVIRQFDPSIKQRESSPRAVIARALEVYMDHLDVLVGDFNGVDKDDFEATADARFEATRMKQTNCPTRTPPIRMEILERHGVAAGGKIHTLYELKDLFNKPKVQKMEIPFFLLSDEEKEASNKAYLKRKAKREAKARGNS